MIVVAQRCLRIRMPASCFNDAIAKPRSNLAILQNRIARATLKVLIVRGAADAQLMPTEGRQLKQREGVRNRS